jgi:hypothetical protein
MKTITLRMDENSPVALELEKLMKIHGEKTASKMIVDLILTKRTDLAEIEKLKNGLAYYKAIVDELK